MHFKESEDGKLNAELLNDIIGDLKWYLVLIEIFFFNLIPYSSDAVDFTYCNKYGNIFGPHKIVEGKMYCLKNHS